MFKDQASFISASEGKSAAGVPMNLKAIGVGLMLAVFPWFASAQTSAAASYFHLVEAKAGCQRLAKLHVQRQVVKADDWVGKNLSRTVSDLERIASLAPEWSKHVKRPDLANKLVADIKGLNAIVATPAASEAALVDALALADRCTGDAEDALNAVQGAGAGGRAVTLASKALYLSQRLTRDWMLMQADTKFKGITQQIVEKERDQLAAVLQQLATLPTTAATRASLDLAQNQWTLLRPMLAGKATPEKEDQVGRISERLYEALNESFEQIQKAVLAML